MKCTCKPQLYVLLADGIKVEQGVIQCLRCIRRDELIEGLLYKLEMLRQGSYAYQNNVLDDMIASVKEIT